MKTKRKNIIYVLCVLLLLFCCGCDLNKSDREEARFTDISAISPTDRAIILGGVDSENKMLLGIYYSLDYFFKLELPETTSRINAIYAESLDEFDVVVETNSPEQNNNANHQLLHYQFDHITCQYTCRIAPVHTLPNTGQVFSLIIDGSLQFLMSEQVYQMGTPVAVFALPFEDVVYVAQHKYNNDIMVAANKTGPDGNMNGSIVIQISPNSPYDNFDYEIIWEGQEVLTGISYSDELGLTAIENNERIIQLSPK